MGYRSQEDIDGFIEEQLKTCYEVVGDCWVWQGYRSGNGYGLLARHLKRSKYHVRAHKASYQYHIGEVPEGLYVCHTCDNKLCINPVHLWLGTNQENQQDAVRKGVFDRAWTPEMRLAVSKRCSGKGNPMYGKSGELAPCYGRCGKKHPLYGTTRTDDECKHISDGLKRFHKKGKRGIKDA